MTKTAVLNYGIEILCPQCGGNFWVLSTENVKDYGEAEFASLCPACRAKRHEKDETGVPAQFFDADLNKFDFAAYCVDTSRLKSAMWGIFNQFETWQKYAKGIYLYSAVSGSGKTFLLSSIGKSLMMKYGLQMRFVAAEDYLARLKDNYNRDRGTLDTTEVYRTCDLLLLDDIGAKGINAWAKSELFRLINERMNNRLITFYTSNVPQKKLDLDARTVDRIISTTIPFHMPEESIRRKRAEQEQENILKKLLPAQ